MKDEDEFHLQPYAATIDEAGAEVSLAGAL
jgi:hypothetical protein